MKAFCNLTVPVSVQEAPGGAAVKSSTEEQVSHSHYILHGQLVLLYPWWWQKLICIILYLIYSNLSMKHELLHGSIFWTWNCTPMILNYFLSIAECGGIVWVKKKAVFRSPGFPHGYKKNLKCTWLIKVSFFNFQNVSLNSIYWSGNEI